MYQLFGMSKMAGAFGTVAAIIALILVYLWPVSDPTEFWRVASLAVSITGGLMLVVGQTAIFPWLCRLWGIRDFIPPIDGKWRGEFRSNYAEIAHAFDLPPPDATVPIIVRFEIKARLFHVRIQTESLQPKERYMRADSTAFSIMRCSHTGRDVIHYVFDAFIGDPEVSDVDSFYGAARMVILGKGNDLRLVGTYWTDRNWQRGYNTAGSFTLIRE
jgi:hypothetical protein